MIFNIISTSLYQQLILFCMFYNGSLFFQGNLTPWDKQSFESKNKLDTKIHDYTFIYQTFFSMTLFSFFIMRVEYETLNVFQKSISLFKTIKSSYGGMGSVILEYHDVQDIILSSERRKYIFFFWLRIIALIIFNYVVINHGSHILGILFVPLTWEEYSLSFLIGFGMLIWHFLTEILIYNPLN